MSLGGSITNHPNLEIFVARTEKDLLDIFNQIKMPFKVLGFTYSDGRYRALVSLTRPIKKVSKDKITETIQKI